MSNGRCPNMNHGRWNVPIRFCPNCGEVVNGQMKRSCDPQQHTRRKKDGDQFCVDCGQKIGEK